MRPSWLSPPRLLVVVGKRTWLGPALDAEISSAGEEEVIALLHLPAMMASLQVKVKGNIPKSRGVLTTATPEGEVSRPSASGQGGWV